MDWQLQKCWYKTAFIVGLCCRPCDIDSASITTKVKVGLIRPYHMAPISMCHMLVFDCPGPAGHPVSLIEENGLSSLPAMTPFTCKDIANCRSGEVGGKCVCKISERKATIFLAFAHNFMCKMGCDLGRMSSLWSHMCKAHVFELVPDGWSSGLRDVMKSCCLSHFEATLDRMNKVILLKGVVMRAHDEIIWNKCVFDESETKRWTVDERSGEMWQHVTCYFLWQQVYLKLLKCNCICNIGCI
jgi:hypothetical protein